MVLNQIVRKSVVYIIMAILLFLSGIFLGLAIPRSLNIDTLKGLDYIREAMATHQRVVDGVIPVTVNTGSIEFNRMWVDRYNQLENLLEEVR